MSGSGGVTQLLLCALLSSALRGGTPSGGAGPLNGTPALRQRLARGALSLRNCSCASEIQDCNDALANLLCSCRTVPRSSLPCCRPWRLRLHSASQDATHPEQALNIATGQERSRGRGGRPSSSASVSSSSSPFLVSFLDVALLNDLSPLKAYQRQQPSHPYPYPALPPPASGTPSPNSRGPRASSELPLNLHLLETRSETMARD
ncbi:hypothetical protein SKAU_G00260190 [Synaphobranchus kaupii]|uniref:Uncharacterized protein n=1 Tax=Synaphobranchus kaupii TaxID=118154 RepID=A0A9Q1F4Q5_SYNKA|nr:hypothetical protein SKAU_G00260190 [Synaphobranchus kaupii]